MIPVSRISTKTRRTKKKLIIEENTQGLDTWIEIYDKNILKNPPSPTIKEVFYKKVKINTVKKDPLVFSFHDKIKHFFA